MSKSAQSDTPTEGATSVDVLCAQLEFVCSPIHTIHEERKETCDKVTAKLRALERENAELRRQLAAIPEFHVDLKEHLRHVGDANRRAETAEHQFAALRQHFDDACAVVGLSKESSEPLAAALERKLAEAHKDAERYLKLSIELEAALAAGRKG